MGPSWCIPSFISWYIPWYLPEYIPLLYHGISDGIYLALYHGIYHLSFNGICYDINHLLFHGLKHGMYHGIYHHSFNGIYYDINHLLYHGINHGMNHDLTDTDHLTLPWLHWTACSHLLHPTTCYSYCRALHNGVACVLMHVLQARLQAGAVASCMLRPVLCCGQCDETGVCAVHKLHSILDIKNGFFDVKHLHISRQCLTAWIFPKIDAGLYLTVIDWPWSTGSFPFTRR
jgi:hypothetical protein